MGSLPFLCLDDNEGSSSDTAPLFQMAGDGKNTDDITIPMLFLFNKEGNIILDAIREYEAVEVLLSDKAKDRDLEMENMDQKSSENDSHKLNSEDALSESQDTGAVSEEPEGGGESSAVDDADPLSPASTDSSSVSMADEDPHTPGPAEASAPEPACTPGNSQPQEQNTQIESSSKAHWDSKVQPMESILADWNEDIEAFEMMEKDEL